MSQDQTITKIKQVLKWTLILAYLFFVGHSFDIGSRKWMLMTCLLYPLPLLLQLSRRPSLRWIGFWWGVFLILQTGMTYELARLKTTTQDYLTLPKNKIQITDVKGEGIPGIQGPQMITTDAMGFRTTKTVAYDKIEGIRIFAIGGSTTEQIYLDDKKTWTHLLQENLEAALGGNIQVVNTGYSGLKSKHHLATLQHVKSFYPDVVIFLVGFNDWNKQITESFKDKIEYTPKQFIWGRVFVNENSYLRNTLLGQFIFKVWLRTVKYYEIKKYLNKSQSVGGVELLVDDGRFLAAKRNSLTRSLKFSFHPDAVSSEFASNLDRIAAVCKEENLTCLFLTQPSGYKSQASEVYRAGFWATPPHKIYTLDFDSLVYLANLYNTYVVDFAKKNNLYVYELDKNIEPSYRHMYDDCHFNAEGAKKVADSIAPEVLAILKKKVSR